MARVRLGLGHDLAEMTLVVQAIGEAQQYRAFVLAPAVADDRREILRAVLGDGGAFALFHFRQRIEIDAHARIVPGNALQVLLDVTAHPGNLGDHLVHGVGFGFDQQDQVGRVEIAGVLVQHAVALAQQLALLAQRGRLVGGLFAGLFRVCTARGEAGQEYQQRPAGRGKHFHGGTIA